MRHTRTFIPFHVRDKHTDSLVRQLAAKQGVSLTQAINIAAQHELERLDALVPLPDRIAAIRRRILPRIVRATQTDKEFFDELSGPP